MCQHLLCAMPVGGFRYLFVTPPTVLLCLIWMSHPHIGGVEKVLPSCHIFLNRWNGHRTCQSPLILHWAELYSGTQLPVYTCLYPLGGLVEGVISNWESITVAKRHVENGIARSGWEREWEVKSKKNTSSVYSCPESEPPYFKQTWINGCGIAFSEHCVDRTINKSQRSLDKLRRGYTLQCSWKFFVLFFV